MIENFLENKNFIDSLNKLYDQNEVVFQINRFKEIINRYQNLFSEKDIQLFSTPGRIEIGGNHTDHNAGKVLAASINLDSIAAASKTDNNKITIHSEGYPEPFVVQLENLKPKENEKESSSALIRGIVFRCKELGYQIGGFNVVVTSQVLPGSGLSSSASIEVLIGTILNYLYNDGKIPCETIAQIGKFAENVYFGKPCGLMDQMTCAVGGVISIDFEDSARPVVTSVDFDLATLDYKVLVIDTGGSHADLTDDYASIPQEMKSVAQYFQQNVLRQLNFDEFLGHIDKLRLKVSDRALLRSFHFFADNERVNSQIKALKRGEFEIFLDLVNESGNSSWKWLQNCYTTKNVSEQGLTLALAITENFIKSKQIKGACRVHGGGFAGTILVFIPNNNLNDYVQLIKNIFGPDSVKILDFRPIGTTRLSPNIN